MDGQYLAHTRMLTLTPSHPPQSFKEGEVVLIEPPLVACQEPDSAAIVAACQHSFAVLGPTLEAHLAHAARGAQAVWRDSGYGRLFLGPPACSCCGDSPVELSGWRQWSAHEPGWGREGRADALVWVWTPNPHHLARPAALRADPALCAAATCQSDESDDCEEGSPPCCPTFPVSEEVESGLRSGAVRLPGSDQWPLPSPVRCWITCRARSPCCRCPPGCSPESRSQRQPCMEV